MEAIGLKPFVDSCVWGYADELLKKIDGEFCIPTGWEHYSYELRNRTTTNIHLILNTALQQMIHNSELFIFLGTESSIKVDEYMMHAEQLSSPWIFSELMFARNVKRTERKKLELMGAESFRELNEAVGDIQPVEFRYLLPQSTYSMGYEQFIEWLRSCCQPDDSDYSKHSQPHYTDLIKRINGLQHVDKLYKELGVDKILLESPRFR